MMTKFFRSIPNFVWLLLGAILSFWIGCFLMPFVAGTWAAPAMLFTIIMIFVGFLFTGMMSLVDWKMQR